MSPCHARPAQVSPKFGDASDRRYELPELQCNICLLLSSPDVSLEYLSLSKLMAYLSADFGCNAFHSLSANFNSLHACHSTKAWTVPHLHGLSRFLHGLLKLQEDWTIANADVNKMETAAIMTGPGTMLTTVQSRKQVPA